MLQGKPVVITTLQDGDSPLLRSGSSDILTNSPEIWLRHDDVTIDDTFQYQDSIESEKMLLFV